MVKYNKMTRIGLEKKGEIDSKLHSNLTESSSGNHNPKGWGIPRSFRLSSDQNRENVRNMKESCMKNIFFHKHYDKRLDDFQSKLFLKHIYSVDTPNLIDDQDSD